MPRFMKLIWRLLRPAPLTDEQADQLARIKFPCC